MDIEINWMTIDSIPKDGRPIYVNQPAGIRLLVDWDFRGGGYRDLIRDGSPTHWAEFDQITFKGDNK